MARAQQSSRRGVSDLACLGNPDPTGIRVYSPTREEAFDDVQTMDEAQAEQIVAKLRAADAMLNTGKDLTTVLQALEIGEATIPNS